MPPYRVVQTQLLILLSLLYPRSREKTLVVFHMAFRTERLLRAGNVICLRAIYCVCCLPTNGRPLHNWPHHTLHADRMRSRSHCDVLHAKGMRFPMALQEGVGRGRTDLWQIQHHTVHRRESHGREPGQYL
jgi:hypothetical protein